MHGHRIMQWKNFLLDKLRLEQYAVAVAEKGAALDYCFEFIDDTVRSICRPGDNQRAVTMATKEYTKSSSSLSLYHLE